MNTQDAQQHLAQANQHITEGEARIVHHRTLIAHLSATGQDTTTAIQLLDVLLESLDLMYDHRATILSELANEPPLLSN